MNSGHSPGHARSGAAARWSRTSVWAAASHDRRLERLRLQRLTCTRGVYDLADALYDLCRLLVMDRVATLGDDQAAVRREASHDLLCFLPDRVVIDVLSRRQDDERCGTKRRRRSQLSVAVHFRPFLS